MYDEYDEGGAGGGVGRKVALGLGVVAIAAAGFFAFKAVTKGDGGEAVGDGDTTSSSVVVTTARRAADAPETTADGDEEAGATTSPETSAGPDTTADLATATTAASAAPTTAAPTTAAPTTVPPPPPAQAPLVTQPDGTPAWAIALFDTDKITITGAVPDEAAKQRLQDLAVVSAKPGQAATVDNRLTINPAVPAGVGVRVVELTSVRFPEGSAEILPPHAAELDRAANIMNSLPNVTALVIGHADQRGDEVSNYVISEARADAVTAYLASRGVAPARLSSRAVGEADLLVLDNTDAALELNRRTEFVFFGLLLG